MNYEILLRQIKNQNNLNVDLLKTIKSLQSSLLTLKTEMAKNQLINQNLKSQINKLKKKEKYLKNQIIKMKKSNKITFNKIINDFKNIKEIVLKNNYDELYYKVVDLEKQNLCLKEIIGVLEIKYEFDFSVLVDVMDCNELNVIRNILKEV
ncbi:hypothetical protein DMUE_0943 [Dictyocoela muelleri]|nr:hypothetical protein DMUE_0943 [Dictyocoela muelleri]